MATSNYDSGDAIGVIFSNSEVDFGHDNSVRTLDPHHRLLLLNISSGRSLCWQSSVAHKHATWRVSLHANMPNYNSEGN